MDSTPDPFFVQLIQEREASIARHDEIRVSDGYQTQLRYLRHLEADFLQAVRAVELMTSRAPALYEQLLMFRFMGDLLESNVAIYWLTVQGLHAPVRRELRYMIESSIKRAVVDEESPGDDYESRISTLDHVEHERLGTAVDRLSTPGLDELSHQFRSEVKDLYASLSKYIHPTVQQFRARENLVAKGRPPGFESAADLAGMINLVRRVYDIVLVALMHALGLGLAGDVFVTVLDDDPRWRFHKTKFTSRLSNSFNYKVERQSRG